MWCVWQNEFMAKANRRIPMKVTSVLEQGHVICTIEIHVICKTEKMWRFSVSKEGRQLRVLPDQPPFPSQSLLP